MLPRRRQQTVQLQQAAIPRPAALRLDVHEDDPLDEARLATWIRQAAALPGWIP